jgi:hypothetical protein
LAAEVNNQPPINDERNEDNDEIPHDEVNVDAGMDEQYGIRTGAYNLRPRKPRDYSHLHATLEETVMTQHSMKRGLKEFGDAGVNAVLKELQQLHDRKVLEPRRRQQPNWR